MFAIKTENISKSYKIRHQNGSTQYKTLQETILNLPRTLFRKSTTSENFQALNDVSFEIQPGERVGIIGRNGAGKSTLLKVLSRITEPTSGRVLINGRVASLLEVGTGFHPELTGRENVFMNGAILGMSRVEIKSKFDEIVDFAEVEKFIDTPVKRYSSGMYVRLAFAVAAHLEPEILLVDEVLAVGDALFQKKCLGKMENVSKQDGRTILFVSHNTAAIKKLCNRVIVLKDGQGFFDGMTEDAIDIYMDLSALHSASITKNKNELSNENQFVTIYNADSDCHMKNEFKHDEKIGIVTEMFLPDWKDTFELSVSVYDKDQRRVFTFDIPLKDYYLKNSYVKVYVEIPQLFLTVGKYSWYVCINDPNIRIFDLQDGVCQFVIIETGSVFEKYSGYSYGCVYPPNCKIKSLA
jgi:lipopolysaccharide transport system ATP-binding protein